MQAIQILLVAMLVVGVGSTPIRVETSGTEPDLRHANEPVPFLLDPAQRA